MEYFDENNINVHEGHLGGYIKSSESLAPSGLDVRNGDPLTYQADLWLWAISALNVRSVLDVGCGEGHAALFFQRFGCEVLGIDGSRTAFKDSKIPDHHVQHDYSRAAFWPESMFDMVWSCEFVEHVEEQFIGHFLASFASARRYIMMTFAEPEQVGWHHVNCQPQEYWQTHLGSIGFELDSVLTDIARRHFSHGHFLRAGLVFKRIEDQVSNT